MLLRRGSLGDVVLLGAVTGALEGPVTVVCDRRWAGVAARLTGVGVVQPWGWRGPGRVVDLQGGLAGRWAAPFADRICKRSVRRRLGLWTGRAYERPSVPRLYAEAVGVEPVGPPWIRVPGGDGLALIPGAAWGPKRWGPDRFAAVGRAWQGPVVVLGGPGEQTLVDAVAAAVPGAATVVESGFEGTLDALGRCRVAVAGDTGLMHLAGACGLTVVGLFGPTHPRDGFWVWPGEVVQREGLACRPCALHRVEHCRVGDQRCLVGLEPDRVIEAVRRCAG